MSQNEPASICKEHGGLKDPKLRFLNLNTLCLCCVCKEGHFDIDRGESLLISIDIYICCVLFIQFFNFLMEPVMINTVFTNIFGKVNNISIMPKAKVCNSYLI